MRRPAVAPRKHAVRSGMRHVERAFAVKEIDPEAAVFDAISAFASRSAVPSRVK